MDTFFGIPMGPLAQVLAILLGLLLVVLAAFALRNRVFFKLGVRNVRRRRARTALIVAGLMLGTTIITAALASGDTMSHTIRSTAVKVMGSTDELIAAKGTNADITTPGDATATAYLPEEIVPQLARHLRRTGYVDGVAPAIVESIAVQDTTTRQNNSRVTLFASTASGLAGFSPIRSTDGTTVSLAALRPGEVYLTAKAADDLNAKAGDTLHLFAGDRRQSAARPGDRELRRRGNGRPRRPGRVAGRTGVPRPDALRQVRARFQQWQRDGRCQADGSGDAGDEGRRHAAPVWRSTPSSATRSRPRTSRERPSCRCSRPSAASRSPPACC